MVKEQVFSILSHLAPSPKVSQIHDWGQSVPTFQVFYQQGLERTSEPYSALLPCWWDENLDAYWSGK
jgi:hypothetical protein